PVAPADGQPHEAEAPDAWASSDDPLAAESAPADPLAGQGGFDDPLAADGSANAPSWAEPADDPEPLLQRGHSSTQEFADPSAGRHGIGRLFVRSGGPDGDGGNVGPSATCVPLSRTRDRRLRFLRSGPLPPPWALEGVMDFSLSGTVLTRDLFSADGRLVASRGEIVDLGKLKDAAAKSPRGQRDKPLFETTCAEAVLEAF